MTDNLDERAAELDKVARERYGADLWQARIEAIARQNVNVEALKQIVASPEALSLLDAVGRESLLAEMSRGSVDAEKAYSRIRKEDKKQHAAIKAGR